jgi:hypothetical protein
MTPPPSRCPDGPTRRTADTLTLNLRPYLDV